MSEEHSDRKTASWAINFLLVVVSSLLTLAAVEGVIRGLDLLRPQRLAVGEAAKEAAEIAEATVDEVTASSSPWVIHPYRGISPRPRGEQEGMSRLFNLFGIDSKVEDPRALPEEELIVGVFGGSVARGTALGGGRFLKRAIEEKLGGEQTVRVVNFGVSGYKQPQQVTLLMELLLLDVPIDVVVNLDGFNELVLARSNTNADYHPVYPDYHFWVSGLASNTGALSRRQIQLQARVLDELERAHRIGAETQASWTGRSAVVQALAGSRILEARANSSWAEQELRALPVRKLEEDLWRLDDPCLEQEGHCRDLIVDLWHDSSLMMQRLAEAQGRLYFHVLQPNQYTAGAKDRLHPEEKAKAWAPNHPWSRWAAEGYPALIEKSASLTSQGVKFLDATQIYKSSADADYVDTCCHLTHVGRRKLAQEMGRWIGEILAADPRIAGGAAERKSPGEAP